MKATAISHANIAFIKYWGKKNTKLNLPQNTTLSVNLDNLTTTTTVEFSDEFKEDSVIIDNEKSTDEFNRTIKFIDIIRNEAKIQLKAKITSVNNFPKKSGLASSSSGFSALALAGSSAAGLKLSEKELTILARRGSGSASRSIPDGIVEWKEGDGNKNSFAYKIHDKDYWDIQAIVLIHTTKEKKVGSTEGHEFARTSPFYDQRLKIINSRISKMKKAIKEKDFETFGLLLEEEAIELHVIAMTSKPPILYWEPKTIEIMKFCQQIRNDKNLPVYFTMDAGPQPVLFCKKKDTKKILSHLKTLKGIEKIIVCKPSDGAKLTSRHLF